MPTTDNNPGDPSGAPEENPLLAEGLEQARKALAGLRYGQVSITVHEGRIVQIDVTEKIRLKPN